MRNDRGAGAEYVPARPSRFDGESGHVLEFCILGFVRPRLSLQLTDRDRSPTVTTQALGLAWKNCNQRGHYERLAEADKQRSQRERYVDFVAGP